MRGYYFAIHYALCMSLVACSLDSPKHISSTPSVNNTQIQTIQPVLMVLDGQQRNVRGNSNAFTPRQVKLQTSTLVSQYNPIHVQKRLNMTSRPLPGSALNNTSREKLNSSTNQRFHLR